MVWLWEAEEEGIAEEAVEEHVEERVEEQDSLVLAAVAVVATERLVVDLMTAIEAVATGYRRPTDGGDPWVCQSQSRLGDSFELQPRHPVALHRLTLRTAAAQVAEAGDSDSGPW